MLIALILKHTIAQQSNAFSLVLLCIKKGNSITQFMTSVHFRNYTVLFLLDFNGWSTKIKYNIPVKRKPFCKNCIFTHDYFVLKIVKFYEFFTVSGIKNERRAPATNFLLKLLAVFGIYDFTRNHFYCYYYHSFKLHRIKVKENNGIKVDLQN